MRYSPLHLLLPLAAAALFSFVTPPAILTLPAIFVAGGAMLYWLGSTLALQRWLGARDEPELPSGTELPPVTFLRPLKRGVPALREKLDALAEAMRAGDQLIIGADDESLELVCARDVVAAFSEKEIVVVACGAGAAANPKIAKLVQMAPRARHEHQILSDSEALLDGETLLNLRVEWAQRKGDVLTCAYRFANVRSIPQCLDAMAALLGLLPGLASLRTKGCVGFTLGACTALRRADLALIGGWEALAHELAEDNRLGQLLTTAGRRVRLSRWLVTIECDDLTARDYWRHQHRVAVTYRVCSPGGFFATILTHGTPAGFILLGLAPASRQQLLFASIAAVTLGTRALTAWNTARLARARIPALPLVALAVGLLEPVFWLASWFSTRVWWSGRWRRIDARGVLQDRSAD